MKKLKFVFVDNDEAYLNAINKYLLVHKLNSLQVIFASNHGYLKELLENQDTPFDLLLIQPDMLSADIDLKRVGMTVLLSETSNNSLAHQFKSINKFQPADKLINQLLELLSEESPDFPLAYNEQQSGTRIILFYSPAGGVGTTVTCISAAMMTAKLGKGVLYLNLENLPSQQLILPTQGALTSSRLYYAIKKKSNNLSLKLETIKLVDIDTGLHYLAPPDSMLDLEELNLEDLHQLILALRLSKAYEYVFIDISSHFNYKSKYLMETCDLVTLITSNSKASQTKALLLERELRSNKLAQEVTKKLTVILNQYQLPPTIEEKGNGYGFLDTSVEFRLPWVEDFYVIKDQRLRPNLNNGYGKVISQYVARLINSNKRDEGLWKKRQ